MMRSPGFMRQLQQDFERMPLDLLRRIDRHGGLEVQCLFDSLKQPIDYTVHEPDDVSPHARTSVTFTEDVAIVKYVPNLSTVECYTTASKQKIQLTHHETPVLTPDHTLRQPVQLVPCGTGDIFPLLSESGLLETWRETGISHVLITQDDTVDIDLVGDHSVADYAVTCVVRPTKISDVVFAVRHSGVDQLVSKFRLAFDDPFEQPEDRIAWAWTGTAVVDLRIDHRRIRDKWHRRPRIDRGEIGYSFQRFFEDVTSTYKTRFVT